FKPDIRVDTNRDGIVDISPLSKDIEGKNTWTLQRGAIFIANIGYTIPPSECPVPIFKSYFCNNGVQDTALAPEYLAPIRTVPLKGVVPEGIVGRIEALGEAKFHTSIFYKDSGNWTITTAEKTFTVEQLKKGLELGIQGKELVRDDRIWDGTARIRFSLNDPASNVTASDEAMLKIAPVLTHHHLQRATKVFASGGNDTLPDQVLFTANMSKQVKEAGIREPVHLFQGSDDPWAQDFFEPGYTSFPGPDGPIILRILLRSPQPTRASGGQLLGELAARGVGVVETSDGSRVEINSMGNLETIPPYRHDGREFPAGRILIGEWKDQRMAWGLVGLLKAQTVQDPLFMDTDWLRAGHVDEVFQFLPDNEVKSLLKDGYKPWRVAVASPAYALGLLRKAEKAGFGNTKLVSRDKSFGAHIPDYTISSYLANKENIKVNEAAWKRIQGNIDQLQKETGVRKEDIISLPVLYENNNGFNSGSFYGNYNASKLKVGPVLPSAVNGLLLTDTKVVAPRQWGPVIEGKDIFEEAIENEYRKLGIQVAFVDDWTTHHEGGGDVHCGTNSFREGGKWW
ncbi:hypothetical protein BDZ91DRAFT_616571, partial [Kalaharituber pfeilii]